MAFRQIMNRLIGTATKVDNVYAFGSFGIVALVVLVSPFLMGFAQPTVINLFVALLVFFGVIWVLKLVLRYSDLPKPKEETAQVELKGKKIVFSGTLEQDRATHKRKAESWGATVTENVTRQTDYLIVGTRPGETKLKSAREYNIQQIKEKEWIEMTRSLR